MPARVERGLAVRAAACNESGLEERMARGLYDIAIIGGGVMGWSAAFWLARLGGGKMKIAVLERDPSHARSATALSVASIRYQFSNPVNVRLSAFGMRFLRNFRAFLEVPDVPEALHVQENGYLFLAGTPEQEAILRRNAEVQNAAGARTMLLDRAMLATRFEALALEDVTLGALGAEGEGWFDNMGLLAGLRAGARARGVEAVTGEAVGYEPVADVARLRLAGGGRIDAARVVNAAGPGAGHVARMMGEELPVEPRKRTVFVADIPGLRHAAMPLIVDHTGFYARPEGRYWLCAEIPDSSKDGPASPDDFEPDHGAFERFLWERVAARLPEFATARVIREWAGHYDYNSLDQNAFIGMHPGRPDLWHLNGFSGHGLQHAPGAGRGLAELMLEGAFKSLDLSDLSAGRLATGRVLHETGIV